MKKIHRLLSALLGISLVLSGCSSSDKTSTKNAKTYKIGISQFLEHAALDEARLSFIERLAELGLKEGENLTIDYQNSLEEFSVTSTIAEQFANGDYDLLLGIATPSAQALVNAIKDTPILFTAITDPVDAQLVDSIEKPGGNVTGTSDEPPMEDQLKLLKALKPEAKKLTILYNSSEANSVTQAKHATELAENLGYEVFISTVTSTNDLRQVVEKAVSDTDAMYTPLDNTVANGVVLVADLANNAKIPYVVSEDKLVEGGALATLGISYATLGRMTADMAAKILLEGVKPEDIPVEKSTEFTKTFNLGTAKKIDITIPEDLLKDARIIE